MELCNGGDLERLKEARGGRFSEIEARLILQQLVAGFKEIYKKQVMHRDLKLANILVHLPKTDLTKVNQLQGNAKKIALNQLLGEIDLVKEDIQIKIADLGFARLLQSDDLSQTMCGTPLVMAPEVLYGKKYNHKADVWSLGIVMFEMLTGFSPFTGRDRDDLARNLDKGIYKLPKELKLSLAGLDFLNCCLQYDSQLRMSWDELVKHPYITSNPKVDQVGAQDDEMMLSYSEYHG